MIVQTKDLRSDARKQADWEIYCYHEMLRRNPHYKFATNVIARKTPLLWFVFRHLKFQNWMNEKISSYSDTFFTERNMWFDNFLNKRLFEYDDMIQRGELSLEDIGL
jgi:hypothetical protein